MDSSLRWNDSERKFAVDVTSRNPDCHICLTADSWVTGGGDMPPATKFPPTNEAKKSPD
jgi:hypothetical protein